MVSIPVLSGIVEGVKVFFKTRRYVAYLIVFVATTFLALFVGIILSLTSIQGTPTEVILVNVFVFIGATGTIYFGIGALLLLLRLDKLWITRRGRGRVTEMKGVAWISVSLFLAVMLRIVIGEQILFFFAAFCWVGWIGFQGYLSSRTGLRVATIAEPKKGSIGMGGLSFIVLLIGIGIIAAEAILALVIIPGQLFNIDAMLAPLFPSYFNNIMTQLPFVTIAMGLMGLFAFICFIAFMKYARKGAALNIAILTTFIAIYAGYFLVNILRRTGAPTMEAADILMSLFFLVYAMSGIGRTITEEVEESRSRTSDLGPLLTFFLASGFFFVDSIIAASASGSSVGAWFFFDWTADTTMFTFVFRDVAKLMAFPLVSIFTILYYLRVERADRVVDRAEAEGEKLDRDEVDDDVARELDEREEPEHIKEGKPGHDLQPPPDSRRLRTDGRRLGAPKRLGDDDDDNE